jgi:phage terminase large subunit
MSEIKTPDGTRIFIPAKVQENRFLMESNPEYIRTLDNLPENERKALRDGEWDLFEGRFFTEWDPQIHVIKPFPIPKEWRRVYVMDYGLDMLAGYWIALDTVGYAYVYREIYESGLIISEAAKKIKEATGDDTIEDWCAPPDLWNRRQETGRSVADWFAEYGIYLRKVNNGREQGWLDLREWLKVFQGEDGLPAARLRVFNTCRNVIRVMPSVIYDPKNPNDISNEPHELTHAPDALRYFAASRPIAAYVPKEEDPELLTIDKQISNIFAF